MLHAYIITLKVDDSILLKLVVLSLFVFTGQWYQARTTIPDWWALSARRGRARGKTTEFRGMLLKIAAI